VKYKTNLLDTFFYWINERQRIYVAKEIDKKPWPWTKDKILKTYKFTNVFRQLDFVTRQWEKRFVNLLGRGKKMSDGDLLFHCSMFRLFNWPATYDALYYGIAGWHKKAAMRLLTERMNAGDQIFTGAYIIPNAGREDPKIQVICEALDYLRQHRDQFAADIRRHRSIEEACLVLQDVPTIGGFISYEIACDLRFTRLLADATDINSWANPGPGAQRGINRLLTGGRWVKGKKPDYVAVMRDLLGKAARRVNQKLLKKVEWPFEMREIEHSLCEFDKYVRVKNGEGRPRSKYISRQRCKICERYLNDSRDLLSREWEGQDCLQCAADAGDIDAKKEVAALKRRKKK